MGGKRSARVQLATSNQLVSSWQLELVKYEIRQKVTQTFLEVVVAQEKVILAEENKRLAEDMLSYVVEHVDSGKQSPIQRQKAEMTVAARDVILKKADRDFALAKQYLSSLWGCSEPDFECVNYPFYEVILESFPDFCVGLQSHPLVSKWDTEIEASYDAVHLEYAQRVPDLTVSAGVEQDNGFDDTFLYLGLSFPIPIFNQNQGNISKAYEEVHLAEEKKRQAILEIEQEWKTAYVEMESAYQQVLVFRDQVVDKALNSFELTKEGFREGKFPYIEVLDAQKSVFEYRESFIDMLGEYHTKKSYVANFFSPSL